MWAVAESPKERTSFRRLAERPWPVGHDIRRDVAGYLAIAGRVIFTTAGAHHRNIRSAGLRTPAGPWPSPNSPFGSRGSTVSVTRSPDLPAPGAIAGSSGRAP